MAALAPAATKAVCLAATLGMADAVPKDGEDATSAEVAAKLCLREFSVRRLFDCLLPHGFFSELAPGRYRHNAMSALLCSDGPLHMRIAQLASDFGWSALEFTIGRPGDVSFRPQYKMPVYAHLETDAGKGQRFSDAMTAFTQSVNGSIVGSYDWSSVGTVADIGGAPGVLLQALQRAHPQLHGIVVDFEQVMTECRSAYPEDLLERTQFVAADLLGPDNSTGLVLPHADVHLLRLLLHQFEKAGQKDLLRRVRSAGVKHVVVAEFIRVSNDDATLGAAFVAAPALFNLLSARDCSLQDMQEVFHDAGFSLHVVQTASSLSLLIGTPV